MNSHIAVDDYIQSFTPEVQEILKKVRSTIREMTPDATEKMSYGIPTYWQGRNIVHFGAYPHHIGFYPGSSVIEALQDNLTNYETSKGTIRFPIDKPIPYDLIKSITEYSVALHAK